MGSPFMMGSPSASPPALEWSEQEFALQFRFGEKKVGTARFRAKVLRTHFLRIRCGLSELLAGLVLDEPSVDMMVLGSVPCEGTYARFTRQGGWLYYVPKQFPRYYVNLTTSFEEYLGSFSSKSRSTLRRKVRKFEEFSQGKIDIREYRTPEEFKEFYRHAMEVSLRTYQHRLLDAGLPGSEAFQAGARALAAVDRVRAYLLFHQGKAVAYLYCPVEEGVLLYAYLGYEASYAEWSCGTVLQYLAFERLFNEKKFQVFDFTEGEGESKQFFGNAVQQCALVLCVRRTVRNVLVIYAHALLAAASKTVVEALDRLGSKRWVKKALRRI